MMSDEWCLRGPRRLVRVLACVAPPFDPGEVHELAVADVAVGGEGVRLEAVRTRRFVVCSEGSRRACRHYMVGQLAEAVWTGEPPGVLAAHDAGATSLVFAPSLTGPLPWISLHKVARRVWPGQPSYDLELLARWRGWAGPRGPFSTHLPSGAEREVDFAAGLLRELLEDPGLPDAGEAAWLEASERERPTRGGVAFDRNDAIQAALCTSSMPSRPLRNSPTPYDDRREWAGVGLDDLRHFARFSPHRETVRAARAELRRRKQSMDREAPQRLGCFRRG